jgi:hypothetical protein
MGNSVADDLDYILGMTDLDDHEWRKMRDETVIARIFLHFFYITAAA